MEFQQGFSEVNGPCLRNFNEEGDLNSVNGALKLRTEIEKIIDTIWDQGFDNIFFPAFEEVCGMSGEEFAKEILHKKMNAALSQGWKNPVFGSDVPCKACWWANVQKTSSWFMVSGKTVPGS